MSSMDAGADDTTAAQQESDSGKHRGPWLWVSIALAVAVVGLVIWGVSTQSKLDDTQQQVDTLQSQADQAQETGGTIVTAAKAAYDSVLKQLGLTQAELEATQQDVKDAEKAAAEAEQKSAKAQSDVEAAKGAAEKAQAEVTAAQAKATEAGAKARVLGDCAKSFVGGFGTLFEGSDLAAQAQAAKKELQQIAGECKTALAGS